MKFKNIKLRKRNIDKFKNIAKEDLGKMEEDYKALVENIRTMNTPGLILLSIVGIAIILFFQSNVADFIGLLIFAYPFYIFAQREGHQEGFLDRYYQALKDDKKDR